MHKQAERINDVIRRENGSVFDLMSDKGREAFFPKSGIMAQSHEAKNSEINATIGIALDDDGVPLHLPQIKRLIDLDPVNIFPYEGSYGNRELRVYWQNSLYEKIHL